MYIAALVGSIAAFVCALTPLLGIPFTLVFSITAIVFSILALKKHDTKEKKDAAIISLIISIIAIIVCIIINIFSAKTIVKIIDYYNGEYVDNDNYYVQKFENYTEYNLDDEILLGYNFILKVNNFSKDGNVYYIDASIEALNDSYISIYDFGIYSADEQDFVYSSYYSNSNYTSGFLDEGEKKDIILKFEGEFDDNSELYLMYMDDEDGVKIKLQD